MWSGSEGKTQPPRMGKKSQILNLRKSTMQKEWTWGRATGEVPIQGRRFPQMAARSEPWRQLLALGALDN